MSNVYAYNETTKDLIYAAAEETWPEGYVTVDIENTTDWEHAADVLTVDIKDSVTSIEDSAFQNCTSLTSVILPD